MVYIKRLTILTERYAKTLRDFLREAEGQPWVNVISEGREGGLFFARLTYQPGDAFTQALLVALEEIAITENPVICHAPKLKAAARGLVGAPAHTDNNEALREFLRANNKINLEGYVAFRMADYTYKLDLMTYGLIKKLSKT